MIRSCICRKPPFHFTWFSHFKSTLASDFHVRFPLYHYYSSTSTSPETRQSLSDYLINHHQFSIAAASKVSSRLRNFDSFERCDSILNWFKDIGLSQNQLEAVVSRIPMVFYTDLDRTLKPKHQIFKELGFRHDDVAKIITSDPWFIINRSSSRLSASIKLLHSFLGSVEDVFRLVKISTWFLRTNLDKTLQLNIEFLQKDCGVCPLQIRRFLFNFPRFLLHQPEFIRNIVQRVDDMKFGDRNSGMFLHAVRTMSSMTVEKWEAKLELFRSLGMSDEEICRVFRKSPQSLAASDRKITEIVDLFVRSGKSDMSLIVEQPGLLLFSVEQRIKPRMLLLDLLEANHLIQKRPCLSSMCKLSNRVFLGKFVHPYSHMLGNDLLDKLLL